MEDDFPTKNKKRADRRAARQKFVQRAKHIIKDVWYWHSGQYDHTLELRAKKLHSCGCWMCNRPRKVFGKSFYDIRNEKKEENGEA